jgi:hypothetical protein
MRKVKKMIEGGCPVGGSGGGGRGRGLILTVVDVI